jgi:hypothetical protein
LDNPSGHRINIARWNITYLAAAGGHAVDLRHRMDRMVRAEVADASAGRLTGAISADDPSVWLIRELNLDLAADPVQAEASAKLWGERLASTIQRTIANGDEDGCVLHFPSRAAYLARFARDVAAGVAWGKWYYEEFSSLLSLPPSRAICEALTSQTSHTGPAILSLIAIRGLQHVLYRLTEMDARTIFETWQNALPASSDAGESAWVGRLLQVWSETPFREPNTGREYRPYRDGLWWAALAITRYSGTCAERAPLHFIKHLLDLRSVLAVLDHKSRVQVILALAKGDLEEATGITVKQGAYDPSASLEFFRRNMQGDQDWAREAQGVLLGEQEYLKKTPVPKVIAHGPAIPSLHAGIFRLGPSFLASGFQNSLADLDANQAALIRHIVAVKSLGQPRAAGAGADTGLRLFSGFTGPSMTEALATTDLTKWIWPDSRESYGSCWLLDVVDQTIFLRDVVEDEWVLAILFGPKQADWDDAVARAASHASQLSDSSLRVLLLRSARTTSVRGVIPLGEVDLSQLAFDLHVPQQKLQRGMRPIGDEVAYFSLNEAFPEIPAELDLAATLAARAVLKHFARRLIGFDTSSAEHLYQSFLAGVGFVRDTGERIEVELPQPPLAIVLSMAGMLEETYTLPWIQRREVCLLRSSE